MPRKSDVLSRRNSAPVRRRARESEAPATVLGRLVALGDDGVPWVTGEGIDKPCPAKSLVALGPGVVNRELLLCRAGRSRLPVIVGLMRGAGDRDDGGHELDLTIDRRRLVLSAQQEVVLRCGDASITLNAQGQVTIRGAQIVTSAKGTNRIRGGTVRIN